MAETKNWLDQLKKIDGEIEELKSILKNEAGRYAGMLTAINETLENRERRRIEIMAAIEKIDDPIQRAILYGVHMNGKSLQEIRAEINYSESHTYRLYKQAVDAVTIAQCGQGDKIDIKDDKQPTQKQKRNTGVKKGNIDNDKL